jgi:4'-phosphopantetheinyl transferase
MPNGDARADIWILPIPHVPSPKVTDACTALLSAEERARAARFRFERDRATFVLSHALTRTVLSRYADVPPADWRFEVNEQGCPFVAAPAASASLRFNLSHTDGCAVVAVARGRDVGIDVEALARPVDLDVADRFFASAEVAAVREAPAPLQRRVFLEIWTLKEAYIKARGVGLAIGLQGFTCTRADDGAASIAFGAVRDDPAAWQLLQFHPTPSHVGALAVRRAPGETVAIEVHPPVALFAELA